MDYRQLGKSGMQVSALGLGTMVFGWRTPADAACAIVDCALDRGINLIDTSNSYGRGRSEEIVGDALARNRRRHAVILSSKLHIASANPEQMGSSGVRDHIVRQCEESLRRLRTDYLDLYHIHGPVPEVPSLEALAALDALVRAGKVRQLASSNFSAEQIAALAATVEANGLAPFVVEQAPYNLLDRSIEREILPLAARRGLGVIAWSPLAEGILSGKYRRGEPLPEDSRYAKIDKPGFYRERLVDALFDHVEAIGRLAQQAGCTASAFCLAWLTAQCPVSTVLIGPSRLAQLEDHLASQDIMLSDRVRHAVDALVPPGSVISRYALARL